MNRSLLLWIAVTSLFIAGCPSRAGKGGSDDPSPAADDRPVEPIPIDTQAITDAVNEPHRVVFADRTSQGYLLLVDDAHAQEPTRGGLTELVRTKLGDPSSDMEIQLLVDLIAMEPKLDHRVGADQTGAREGPQDLLGLHLELLPLGSGPTALIPPEHLEDPILTRALTPADRASLDKRQQVVLLRADYRNQFAVRGLRLLQSLVRLVAEQRNALVHDPDTGETMNVATFTERRLQSSLGNVADQIAVVPFPDRKHGNEFVRLTTRGMRRFGSVDLELDGLPKDPAVLQAATHFINGLALQMVREGEFDAEGYAVELPETVTLTHADVSQAYGRRKELLPKCESCPAEVELHLVERDPQPNDPRHHVVARIVAPRPVSDAAGYDHPAWVRTALRDLLGE